MIVISTCSPQENNSAYYRWLTLCAVYKLTICEMPEIFQVTLHLLFYLLFCITELEC